MADVCMASLSGRSYFNTSGLAFMTFYRKSGFVMLIIESVPVLYDTYIKHIFDSIVCYTTLCFLNDGSCAT